MPQKQINIRVDSIIHRTIETVARQERRTVGQMVRLLIEEGLKVHSSERRQEDTSAHEIASLAVAGRAFEWLNDEPDIYDDSSGEPV